MVPVPSQFVHVTGSVPGSVKWPWQRGHSIMASWLTVFSAPKGDTLSSVRLTPNSVSWPRLVRDAEPGERSHRRKRCQKYLEAVKSAVVAASAAQRIFAAEESYICLFSGLERTS